MTIDDYSHYIWTLFLGAKKDALDKFRILGRKIRKAVLRYYVNDMG